MGEIVLGLHPRCLSFLLSLGWALLVIPQAIASPYHLNFIEAHRAEQILGEQEALLLSQLDPRVGGEEWRGRFNRAIRASSQGSIYAVEILDNHDTLMGLMFTTPNFGAAFARATHNLNVYIPDSMLLAPSNSALIRSALQILIEKVRQLHPSRPPAMGLAPTHLFPNQPTRRDSLNASSSLQSPSYLDSAQANTIAQQRISAISRAAVHLGFRVDMGGAPLLETTRYIDASVARALNSFPSVIVERHGQGALASYRWFGTYDALANSQTTAFPALRTNHFNALVSADREVGIFPEAWLQRWPDLNRLNLAHGVTVRSNTERIAVLSSFRTSPPLARPIITIAVHALVTPDRSELRTLFAALEQLIQRELPDPRTQLAQPLAPTPRLRILVHGKTPELEAEIFRFYNERLQASGLRADLSSREISHELLSARWEERTRADVPGRNEWREHLLLGSPAEGKLRVVIFDDGETHILQVRRIYIDGAAFEQWHEAYTFHLPFSSTLEPEGRSSRRIIFRVAASSGGGHEIHVAQGNAGWNLSIRNVCEDKALGE